MKKLLGKIPFIRPYSTRSLQKRWANREVDWVKDYQSTWTHPHRALIMGVLRSMKWQSLWEVGVGAGANLMRIVKELPPTSLGGCDVNAEAIEVCRKTFNGGQFQVESGEDMFMSDKSTDVVLSDMTLIYVGPGKIRKYLREFARITRNYIILVEFDESNWWKRQWERMNGHHAHDFRKLLAKEGYTNIMIQPIPAEFYPGIKVGMRKLITAKPR